ncbi:histidine phosphatase family protein [Pelagibacterium limicola]|uniref:histidine phosphatase family protein n=1 Tax=Pelagibacterium limicola TaxID=2791022 RepID=UPI0018AFDFAD|nr:histidine phosphatase family protein [Pelagibacterium limicola]
MGFAIYLSHPEVEIAPDIPVPQWRLSKKGRERADIFGRKLQTQGISRIVSSTETKALETAGIIGDLLELAVAHDPEMGENDRSATGFVPPDRFEALADAFFAAPDRSVMGWETAQVAQTRIVAAVERALLGNDPAKPVLFVGHGAVGTLLRCALAHQAIDRIHDQKGAGNAYAFTLASRRLLCEWTPIEKWERCQWPES